MAEKKVSQSSICHVEGEEIIYFSDEDERDDQNIVQEDDDEVKEKRFPPPPDQLIFPMESQPKQIEDKDLISNVQAIVLAAGGGSQMGSLVKNHNKALLPIGSVPMFYYSLYYLQLSGFKECILIVSEGMEKEMFRLARYYEIKMRLYIYGIKQTDSESGTLDSLRQIYDNINVNCSDTLILSGDLVTDVEFTQVYEYHINKQTGLTIMSANLNTSEFTDTPGHKQPLIEPDIIVEEMDSGALVYSIGSGDCDEIKIPYSMQQGGSLVLCADVADCHYYLMNTSLLMNYILSKKSPCASMTSLRHDAIPYILKKGGTLRDYICSETVDHGVYNPDLTVEKMYDSLEGLRLDGKLKESTKKNPIGGGKACHKLTPRFPPAEDELELRSEYKETRRRALPKISYNYFHEEGIGMRANTIKTYWHLNKIIAQHFPQVMPTVLDKIKDTSDSIIKEKAVIQGNTFIGPGSYICEKTTITDTSIGRNCHVAEKSIVTNCVLLEAVMLHPGTVMENCLVVSSVKTEGCTFKNCIIASSANLEPGKCVTGETLDIFTA